METLLDVHTLVRTLINWLALIWPTQKSNLRPATKRSCVCVCVTISRAQGRTGADRPIRGERRLRAGPGPVGRAARPRVRNVQHQADVRQVTAAAAAVATVIHVPGAAAAAAPAGTGAVPETGGRGHGTSRLGRRHTHRAGAVVAEADRAQERRPDQLRKVQMLVLVQLQVARHQVRKYNANDRYFPWPILSHV